MKCYTLSSDLSIYLFKNRRYDERSMNLNALGGKGFFHDAGTLLSGCFYAHM